MFEKKLRKNGNSVGLTIPSDMLKVLGVKENDSVYLSLEDRRIVISADNQTVEKQDDPLKEKVIKILEEYFESKKEEQK